MTVNRLLRAAYQPPSDAQCKSAPSQQHEVALFIENWLLDRVSQQLRTTGGKRNVQIRKGDIVPDITLKIRHVKKEYQYKLSVDFAVYARI